MKTSIIQSLFCLLLSVSLTTWVPGLRGEDAAVESDERDDVAEALLTDEELDKLTGPIALYPDALVALILPASTEVADVVMAARFFARGGKESEVASQPWDESVRALARYSEVILWMDENLAWTRQLGAAFLTQPADVMQAVQRMRAKAKAAGNLESNQEQTVIEEPNYIRIVPTQPEVIYVPRYNPEIVYVPVTTYYGPVIAYGAPYPCGAWLRYDCNWLSWSIWLGTWNFAYYRQPAWCPPRGGGHWSPPPLTTHGVRRRANVRLPACIRRAMTTAGRRGLCRCTALRAGRRTLRVLATGTGGREPASVGIVPAAACARIPTCARALATVRKIRAAAMTQAAALIQTTAVPADCRGQLRPCAPGWERMATACLLVSHNPIRRLCVRRPWQDLRPHRRLTARAVPEQRQRRDLIAPVTGDGLSQRTVPTGHRGAIGETDARMDNPARATMAASLGRRLRPLRPAPRHLR